MLCGLFALAAAQLVGFVVLLRALPPGATPVAGFVFLTLVIFGWAGSLVVALSRGLWRALRLGDVRSSGPALDGDQAPGLWALVREVAEEAGTRPPHEVRLMSEIDFRYAHAFLRGRRTLFLGLPLLQSITVGQARFGLAHHLGHFAAGHTRWVRVVERCEVAIVTSAEVLRPTNPASWGFKAYRWLYDLVDGVCSRRWEYRADAVGVRVAGTADAVGALHEIAAVREAWEFFCEFHLVPGLEAGKNAADRFGGFAEFVAARKDEVDDLRARPLATAGKWWDTYPSPARRAAVITARFPDVVVPSDGRSAASLILDPVAAGNAVQEADGDPHGRPLLEWPEFTHAAVTARLEGEAAGILGAIGLTGPGLPGVLRMLEDGRLDDLARPLFPDAAPGELPELFLTPLEVLLNLAAVRAGQAMFRHSWTEPAELFTPDGSPLDLSGVAERAITDPRGATTELAARGIGIWRA